MDGSAVDSGFDPLELPPDRFFNWVYSRLVKDRNERERIQLDAQLLQPLPGQVVDSETRAELVGKATQLFRTATAESF